MGLAAAAVGGSALLGAGASIYGANAQSSAANRSIDLQQKMFDTTSTNLSPFIKGGQDAFGQLGSRLGDLSAPVTMDEATLQQTPGYQFNLQQGQQAIDNSNAAKGWGLSGAGLKGLAQYVTGLADNTYQNQFANAWTNKSNGFNMLLGTANVGTGAATNLGSIGAGTAGRQGEAAVGAGNAQAAGGIGVANSLNPANMLLEYQMLSKGMNGAAGATGANNDTIYAIGAGHP